MAAFVGPSTHTTRRWCQFNQPLNTKRIIMFLFISAFMCIIAGVCSHAFIQMGKPNEEKKRWRKKREKMKINDVYNVLRHIWRGAFAVVALSTESRTISNVILKTTRQAKRQKHIKNQSKHIYIDLFRLCFLNCKGNGRRSMKNAFWECIQCIHTMWMRKFQYVFQAS